jgi:hypothetical protein
VPWEHKQIDEKGVIMKRKSTILFTALVILSLLLGANSTWGAPGDLLWETNFNFLPDYEWIPSPPRVDVSSSLVIIGGNALPNQDSSSSVLFIKAFGIAKGDLKWERTFPTHALNKLNIIGKLLYLEYQDTGNFIHSSGYYDITTGKLLWEKTIEHQEGHQVSIYPSPTPQKDNKCLVIVDTFTGGNPTDTNINVKVYRATK